MDTLTIGKYIRYFREEKGMKQFELAKIVNLSAAHLSDIEKGTQATTSAVLVDIVNALEIPFDYFLIDCDNHFLIHAIDDYFAKLKLDANKVEQSISMINRIKTVSEKDNG